MFANYFLTLTLKQGTWPHRSALVDGGPRRIFIATSTPLVDKPIFLDGSGGQFSSDPRLRKCGWAWIQYDGDSIWGQRGSLGGRQTVPRSEIRALDAALGALTCAPFPRSRTKNVRPVVHIYSDNAMVVKRFADILQGRYTYTVSGDLWDSVLSHMEYLYEKCDIHIHKVKALHLRGAMDLGEAQDPALTKGNELADEHAVAAAFAARHGATMENPAGEACTLEKCVCVRF